MIAMFGNTHICEQTLLKRNILCQNIERTYDDHLFEFLTLSTTNI